MGNFKVFGGVFIQLFIVVHGVVPPHSSSPATSYNASPLPHPLDPLSALEIQKASQIIRNHFRQAPHLTFCTVTLKEPNKAELLPYFLQDVPPPATIALNRRAFVNVINPLTQQAYEVVVDLLRQSVESVLKLPKEIQPPFPMDEEDDVRPFVLRDEGVQLKLGDLGINNISSVETSFWDFGYAGDRPEYFGKRISQIFFFMKGFPEDNFFAHPMGFIAIVDLVQKRVLGIEDLPIHGDFDVHNREGDEIPLAPHNYEPTSLPLGFFRKDVSPIDISQVAGPSFKIVGRQVEWQNFKLRIGFNEREGLVLHNINYNDNGIVRPLIYRASLSELFVNYGDPRPPFQRKMAFDAGQYGIGGGANELHAPADCKGVVKFFNAVLSNSNGQAIIVKQAICVYEEDVGVLMRKYSSRSGRSYSVRNQRLVISFAAAMDSYEYKFLYIFQQDASIRVEVQLTGVVNPTTLAPGSNSGGHGTILSPGILGQNHQHFFAFRIDTEIDGNENTVSVVDVVSAGPTGSPQNPYGNGFTDIETVLRTPAQARTKIQHRTSRSWAIYGDMNKRHPFSNTPMGYRLIAESSAPSMINADSPLHPKGAFVDYNVWVTPYHDDHIFAGGRYLNNSGLPEWTALHGNTNIEHVDSVLWYVFGFTHIPRVEDFPIMSTETLGFWLKPYNFFLENPALNVPSFLHIPN